MEEDMNLSGTLLEPQSNNACRGYAIWVIESCGFNSDDIRHAVMELNEGFGFKSIHEADGHYRNSPYWLRANSARSIRKDQQPSLLLIKW